MSTEAKKKRRIVGVVTGGKVHHSTSDVQPGDPTTLLNTPCGQLRELYGADYSEHEFALLAMFVSQARAAVRALAEHRRTASTKTRECAEKSVSDLLDTMHEGGIHPRPSLVASGGELVWQFGTGRAMRSRPTQHERRGSARWQAAAEALAEAHTTRDDGVWQAAIDEFLAAEAELKSALLADLASAVLGTFDALMRGQLFECEWCGVVGRAERSTRRFCCGACRAAANRALTSP